MKKIVYLMLSLLMLLASVSTVIAKELEERKITDDKKAWEIFMTDQVRPSSVSGNIYIEDQYGKNVEIEISVEGEKIKVTPLDSYKQNNRYKLFVSKNITSVEGVSLEEDVELPFQYSAPSLIKSVEFERGPYFTRVEVETIGRVQNVKVNDKQMHYSGQRTFELGLVDIEQGEEVTINAYDISGKLIEVKKVAVEVAND